MEAGNGGDVLTPAFWRTVGELVDDYERRRDWLVAKEDLLVDAWTE